MCRRIDVDANERKPGADGVIELERATLGCFDTRLHEHAPYRRGFGNRRPAATLPVQDNARGVARHRLEAQLQKIIAHAGQALDAIKKNIAAHFGKAVARAVKIAQPGGNLHHRQRVVAPLGVIGGENFRRRAALDHRRQLPGDVAGVAYARVHTLAEKRRLQMRGVAGEKGAPDLEARGDTRVVGVDAGALDGRQRLALGIMRAHQPGDVRGCLYRLLGVPGLQHKLKTPVAIGQIDAHVHALGVAVHAGEGRVKRVIFDIHHQPFGGQRLAGELHAEQAAHRAAPAIGADKVIAAQFALLTAVRLEADSHAVRVLLQRFELPAEQRADVRIAHQALAQRRLGQRLHENIAPRPAKGLRAGAYLGKAAPQ